MKTSELQGKALNWAVRYALHGQPYSDYVEARDNFSTCWNKAGPIIERERLWVCASSADAGWFAEIGKSSTRKTGPTPLIAAMRCYVASKLGENVDIPKELMQ